MCVIFNVLLSFYLKCVFSKKKKNQNILVGIFLLLHTYVNPSAVSLESESPVGASACVEEFGLLAT